MIIESIKDFYKLEKRTPITRDATGNVNLPAQSVVRKFFGSWNNLIKEAGLPIVKDFENSTIDLPCAFCGKVKTHLKCKIKGYSRSFCNSSCAVSWTNKFGKKTICRRSRLEKYIQKRMVEEFPELLIEYNNRAVVSFELDIYIPSLKLAFELNGIFHYEPIYGTECFDKIKHKDRRKFADCIENQISLCVIDVSSQKNYNDKTNEKYFTIIKDIVSERLG